MPVGSDDDDEETAPQEAHLGAVGGSPSHLQSLLKEAAR
jgi:hypothetical protein